MGKPEPMAGLAGGDHRIGRAAGSLGARAGRVEPQAERDADRVRSGAQERDCAVDAAAHRDRDPAWTAGGREDRRNRVCERVGGESLAGDAGGLDQGQAVERPLEARSVGLDDPIPVDEKPDRRIRRRPARNPRSARREAHLEATGSTPALRPASSSGEGREGKAGGAPESGLRDETCNPLARAQLAARNSRRLPQGSLAWNRRWPGISSSSAQVISTPDSASELASASSASMEASRSAGCAFVAGMNEPATPTWSSAASDAEPTAATLGEAAAAWRSPSDRAGRRRTRARRPRTLPEPRPGRGGSPRSPSK